MLAGMMPALRLQQRCLEWVQRRARPSGLPPHLVTGIRGEQAALFHLRSLGYTVVAWRWQTPSLRGDLDLLAWDGPTLVVFEVKTRTARDAMPAESAVDAGKQRQLRLLAAAAVRQLPRPYRERVGVRFDLLSVYLLGGRQEFEHFPEAFSFRDFA
jgi:putative endonuclease